MVGFVAADAVRTDMGTWSTHCGRPQSEDWRPVELSHLRVFIHHWRSTLLLIWFANRYCLLVAVPLKVLMDNLCFKKVKSFPSLMVA